MGPCLLLLLGLSAARGQVTFSAGFTDDAVLQRGSTAPAVYGFSDGPVNLSVEGQDGDGASVSYRVEASLSPWDGGQWGPSHGGTVWRATLRPTSVAGGSLRLTAAAAANSSDSAAIANLTIGDVWFCSGQSNMALETYYTYSADTLKAEITAAGGSGGGGGRFANLRHFMYGAMDADLSYAAAPQWATLQNTPGAPADHGGPGDSTFVWRRASESARLPSLDAASGRHSAFAQLGATCMYFGAELIAAREAAGVDADVPVGLIQAARGGSQIEAWMPNETLALCTDESLSGGAVPGDYGALFYGMAAPFANFSVRGWLWYQGENNVYGHMGSSADGAGYGCELPAMVRAWRAAWGAAAAEDALFGVATLAAGGSEGNGQHMGGMRWSQTANYGDLPNAAMPHSFLAQVYDLGDPWATLGDGGSADQDPQHCALPDPATHAIGANCSRWSIPAARAALKPLEPLIRLNSPSGVAGSNFMGGIHPRLKRPVGRRLALAAMAQLHPAAMAAAAAAPSLTIAGCGVVAGAAGAADAANELHLVLRFNSTLLGKDTVLVQDGFETNMTKWAGVDSLGAMVCAAAAAPPPPAAVHAAPLNCTQQCVAAGHCCVGLGSGDQQPSCAQGCAMAEFLLEHGASPTLNGSTTLEQCRNTCLRVPQHCDFPFQYNATYAPFDLMTCGSCGWAGPAQPPSWPAAPPGLSPFATCMSSSAGECLEGCAYAHGAATAPIFPPHNETTCGCRTWSAVPCDGGVKGQTDQWPCDRFNRTGSKFWYCEDGPGWKPPAPLRARGREMERLAATAAAAAAAAAATTTAGFQVEKAPRHQLQGPSAPDNPYQTLWRAAPVRSGPDAHSATVDLSALGGAGAVVYAVRYAWPLADNGDTCCPQASVSGNPHAAGGANQPCTPGACPLLTKNSQLPANPFFASVTQDGKRTCVCPAPQVCSAGAGGAGSAGAAPPAPPATM